MKLVSYEGPTGTRLGALEQIGGQEVIADLNQLDSRIPSTMIEFLKGGQELRILAERATKETTAGRVNRNTVVLKAPIPNPGKIICIGLNYREHAAEANQQIPDYPTLFAKYSNGLIGTGEAIVIPPITTQVDYEGELAVVMGRRARNVAESHALSCVAGYAPFNDVSARDYQHRTTQWTAGKIFDTFGPMGPALVTADEVPDPQNLDLRVTIGDEVLQNSNTRYMIFSIRHLIAYLSEFMTLEPGDIIATGTPSGVGSRRTPQRFLRQGDVVRVEIERLGTLENPVTE